MNTRRAGCEVALPARQMQAIHTLSKATVLAIGLVLMPASVSAQSPEAGSEQPIAEVKSPRAHRFFDSINLALIGIESGAMTADGFYTLRALRRYPGVFYEANPIARPFVARGWPGMVTGGALVVGADLGLRYWLHRAGHHRLERWVPAVAIAASTFGVLNNRRQIRAAERAAGSR